MVKDNKKAWRTRGAEWVVAGTAILVASFILPWAGPGALTLYGLYRWFINRSYKQGVSLIALSALIWVLLMGPLSGLFWPIKAFGALCMGVGAVMMVFPKKRAALDGEEAVVEIHVDENGNQDDL